MKLNRISTVLFFLLIVIISSCTNGTKEINYSKDECDYCKMQISDNRFAAEIITNEGTVYKFDSIECLIGYLLVKNVTDSDSVKFYICDFLNPGRFIEMRNSFFVHNNDFMSPMGLNVQAFSTESECKKFVKANGGKQISWDKVVEMVKKSNE
jgi:copper chaperone NosL